MGANDSILLRVGEIARLCPDIEGVSDLPFGAEGHEVPVWDGPHCLVLHSDHPEFCLLMQNGEIDERIIQFAEGVCFPQKLNHLLKEVVDSGYSFGGDSFAEVDFEKGTEVVSVGGPVGIVLQLLQFVYNRLRLGEELGWMSSVH